MRNARGEGSFTKNANGTVTHRKGVGYKADGGRKTLTVTASSRAACIREMKKKEAEWEQQKELEKIDGKITLAQFCQLHLDYQVENDDLKPKSIDRRECTINNQIAKYPLGKLQLQAVREEDISKHIKTLMDEGKLSGESIVKVVNVINAAYNWGIARKSLQDNPLRASKDQLLKKIRKKTEKDAFEADVTVFSEEEVEKIEREALEVKANGKLKYAAGRQLMLLLYTGIRVGDDDDKIRLNQRKPSKYKGLRRFGPEKNLQRINKFMKERPIFYKNLIQMKENIRFYLRCFYCITKVMILQFNSENRTELARNG